MYIILLSTAMGTNHASVGVATQSSTYENNTAELAIDGNINNDLSKHSCTHTNDDYEPWWKVTFKYEIRVSEVIIVNRLDYRKLLYELFR